MPAASPNVDALNQFLITADDHGLDQAIQLHGTGIDPREIAGLRGLSPADIKQLRDINDKITIGSGFKPGDIAAWTCGAVC